MSKQNVNVTVNIPKSDWEDLKAIAEVRHIGDEKTFVGDVMRDAVQQYVEKHRDLLAKLRRAKFKTTGP